jgi:hypothetical protein
MVNAEFMKQFKIDLERFGEIKKALIRRLILFMTLAIAGAAVMIYFKERHENIEWSFPSFALPFVIFAGIICFFIPKVVKQRINILNTYRLSISDTMISREMINTPTISIHFSEVTSIRKNQDNHIIIKGKDKTDLITIPAQLENYEQMENLLAEIQAIQPNRSQQGLKNIFSIIVALALMIGVFVLDNKYKMISLGCGVLLFALLVWSIIQVQKDKNTDTATKKKMWISLLLMGSVILALIGRFSH